MANKTFPKKTIKVRSTALPSGEAPVTANIESIVAALTESLTTGMSGFFLGNGMFGKDNGTFIAKAKQNKKSVLGDKDSIFEILDDIRSSINKKDGGIVEILNSIDSKTNKIYLDNKDFFDKDIAIIESINKLFESIETKINEIDFETIKDDFNDSILDLQTSLSESLDSLEDKLSNLFSNNTQDIKLETGSISEIIKPFVESNEKLFEINKELREGKEKELLEGRLRMIIEGLDNTSIDHLIEFSKINLQEFDDNAISIQKFLEALQNIEGINFKDINKSINQIIPFINKISESIDTLTSIKTISDDSIEAMDNIFGNGQRLGVLRKLIRSINRIEDIDNKKSNEILKSLINTHKILGETTFALGMMIPMSILWNKGLSKFNYQKIFLDINELFKKVAGIEALEDDKTKQIRESVIALRLISQSIISLGLVGNFAKKVDLVSIATLFDNINGLFAYVKEINTDSLVDNIKEIETSMNTINDIMVSLLKMNLSSKAAKFGNIDIVKEIFVGDNNSIRLVLDSIGSEFNTNTTIVDKKLEQIDNSMNTINNVIISLMKMKWSSKVAKIGSLEKIIDLFLKDKDSIQYILNKIAEIKTPEKNKANKVNSSLSDISTILETLEKISKRKISRKNLENNLNAYIEILDETYKKIREKFNDVIATAEIVERVKNANRIINEGLDNCTQTAIDASKKQDDIEKGQQSLDGLTGFMIGAAIVMSIGALFMLLGGGKFVRAALQFGVTLMAFETLVIAPILVFREQQNNALKSLENLSEFVITCSTVMLIGALFMALGGGKLVENALAFGITLGFFELLVISPFLAFYKVKNNVMKGLSEFSGFLITCTFVMSVGALFMYLSNGKFVKSALQFGVVLGLFELLVISPFILFGLVKNEVFENSKHFTSFLITCTTLMLIGSLFMSIKNGALVRGAIRFASTIMLFESMIIAPFLIMNLFKTQVFNGMKLFSTVAVTCTTLLLIGALFMGMKNGLYVKEAIKFTALIMLFEVGIIVPMLLFNKVKSHVFKGLIDFTAVVLVCTTALIVGALFMTLKGGSMPENALLFAGILAIFEAAVISPILLFNKIKKDALEGAASFGTFILLCTAALLSGSLFITQYGSKPIIEYGIILSVFVGIMSGIAYGLSWCKKALPDMEAFGAFVLLSSAALLVGAFFVNRYGTGSVIAYGLCLLGFVGLMGRVMILLAWGFNSVGGIPIADSLMLALGGFLMMATVSLVLGAWFVETYGTSSVLIYAGILLGFVTLIGLVFTALGALGPFIAIGSVVAVAMGVALLALTTSMMMINALFLLDPGGKKLNKNLDLLKGIICSSLPLVFAGLGILSPLIALGSAAAVLIGVSILILDGSFELINIMMGKHGEELKANIGILNEILGWSFLASTYTVLGLLSPLIALATPAVVGIGASMLILGTSFALVNKFIGEQKEQLKENISVLNELLGFSYLAGTYSLLGILSPLIIPGSLAASALGVSMTILGSSLYLVHKIVESTEGKLIDDITYLMGVVGMLGLFSGELLLLAIPIGLAIPVTVLMTGLSAGIMTSAMSMYITVKKLSELGDLTDSINLITSNLKQFIEIPDEVISFKDLFIKIPRLYMKLDAIRSLAKPMAQTMLISAEAVQNMAELKVPTSWDKDGKAIGYRQLDENDFNLAKTNVSTLLTTMASAFNEAWFGKDGNGKELKAMCEDDDSAVWNTLYFGKKIGEVIKGISEGVGAMAKMQIPIAWDEKGNVIGYRQLKQADFEKAAEGTQTILTHMVGTIIGIYKLGWQFGKDYGNGQNLFLEVSGGLFENDQPSPFAATIESTLKIGELIGNIGKAVADIGNMRIPIEWDSKGHAIDYRTLNKTDFENAAQSVSYVLSFMVGTIASLYDMGKPGGLLNKGVSEDNIFDAITHWYKSDEPSPFIRTLEASFKVSELIGNIGKGIKDIALMQIPVDWNEKGNPIAYEKLQKSDFEDAAQSIGTILTTVVNAVASLEIDPDVVGDTLESIKPVSELISGMSDGIVKLAAGQIPINWDPKTGKAIEYRQLTMEDYIAAGVTIGTIVNFIGQILIDLATKNDTYKAIFDNDKFKDIVESISSTSGLISGIADSIVKIGQAQIPIDWDPKTGKPRKYDKININEARENLKNVLEQIIQCVATTIINVYKENEKLFDGSEDSPFTTAVKGISNVTKIVTNLVDSVIKIGQAQIPYSWDKDGKPIKYKHIDVNTSIADIKKIFGAGDVKNGLLGVLCNIVNEVYKEYFQGDNNISNKIQPINLGVSQIVKMISTSADLMTKLGNMNMPTTFDKDGKGQNYHKLNENDIENSKKVVINLIRGLLDIPKTLVADGILLDDKTSKEYRGQITENIQDITAVINTALGKINVLIKFKNAMNELQNIKSIDDNLSSPFSKYMENLKKNVAILQDIYKINITLDPYGNSILYNITKDLNKFIQQGVKPFDQEAYDRFKMLNGALITIYNTINSQKEYSAAFKNNTEQLSKYVKSINSIQLSKISALTKLVQELNKLGMKVGNLDNLTEAIANNLSTVLQELVDSLKEAKETIDKAENIQDKRHKKIDESIKKFKELTEGPVIIKVSSDTTEDADINNNESPESNQGSTSPQSRGSIGGNNGESAVTPKKRENSTPSSRR